MGKSRVANIEEGGESEIDQGKTEFEVEEKKVSQNTRTGVGSRGQPTSDGLTKLYS